MLYELELDKLHEALVDQQICVTVDESTDACGRAAVNIFFSFKNKTKLVTTKHLKKVDSTTILQFVMSTIQLYNIPYENVRCYISDNAAYMLKLFQFLKPFFIKLYYNTCLAHIYNLVGGTHLSLNAITTPLLSSCFNSSLDTNLDQNENLNIITATLPPLPVKTYWNSWFKFVFWINQHIPFLITFY
ncbi:8595_t:CDS:2 [Cetraspora pellucida]|uniref:8595_t:CDS:1 n=1 Tax=Cetraspora pellucida TaxID=1433469 RepID=A0ACA9MXX9_9GLOM|nr:8595_t:CDS:2 [Cetraspora pellucida]